MHWQPVLSVLFLCYSVSMYQWPVLGSCKCIACVFTCYRPVLRPCGGVIVLLVFSQTGYLFLDLVGVTFILLMFPHASHLFSGLVGVSFINFSTH